MRTLEDPEFGEDFAVMYNIKKARSSKSDGKDKSMKGVKATVAATDEQSKQTTDSDNINKKGVRQKKHSGKKSSSQSSPTKHCHLCDKDGHNTVKCRTLTQAELPERVETVKKAKLCFSCLSPGHNSRNCQAGLTCGVDGCDRRHSKVLHGQEWKRDSSPSKEGKCSNEELI